jgi:hypothetical protein
MATLLLAGLRCAEAIQLRPRDVDLRSSRIRALGKGPKERVVPIEPQLEAYPREFASSAPVERTVLLHARGPAARRPAHARDGQAPRPQGRGERCAPASSPPHLSDGLDLGGSARPARGPAPRRPRALLGRLWREYSEAVDAVEAEFGELDDAEEPEEVEEPEAPEDPEIENLKPAATDQQASVS